MNSGQASFLSGMKFHGGRIMPRGGGECTGPKTGKPRFVAGASGDRLKAGGSAEQDQFFRSYKTTS